MKYIVPTLLVLLIWITAPLWLIPFALYKILWPMVLDMRKVLDGEMKFW